jgi:hypothetical protein
VPDVLRVLAIDPGKTTGVALLHRLVAANTVETKLTAELVILGDNPQHATTLRRIIRGWKAAGDEYPLRIVVERFTITPDTGKKSQEAKAALETIGAVKLMCVEVGYPLDAIVYQGPGEAKAGWHNAKLKRCGLWHRGGAGHALDALRHAATYLVSGGWSDPRMIDRNEEAFS